MSLQIKLTEKQFQDLLSEYHATDEKRQRLTQYEIQTLAEKVNKEIDIPFVSERKEEKILIKIILKIDRFLYDNLPNELYDLIRSDDGISDQEAENLIVRLSKLVNSKIDIPYVPEFIEGKIFSLVIGLIVNAMRKKWNVLAACNKINKEHIPENHNEDEVRNMILAEEPVYGIS